MSGMQRRLFFAIPAQQLSNTLQHSQQQLLPEGYLKPVPADNFHLTLHFLGLQDDSILPSLYQAATQIQSPAFTLLLDIHIAVRSVRAISSCPLFMAGPAASCAGTLHAGRAIMRSISTTQLAGQP